MYKISQNLYTAKVSDILDLVATNLVEFRRRLSAGKKIKNGKRKSRI